MKIKQLLITILAVLAFSNLSAFAVSDTGIIDLRETWISYKKAANIDKLLDQKEVDLEKYVLEKKRKIAEGKTPLERKNLEDKYAKEFKTKLAAIQTWYKTEQTKLDSALSETIKEVAVKKQLKTVLNKKAVVYGGVDITSEVITALNKK